MLGFMFNKIGGLVKDIQVAVTETAGYVYDEVSSIPSELMKGYDSGLISATDAAEDATTEEHIPTVTPSGSTPKTAVRKFGA